MVEEWKDLRCQPGEYEQTSHRVAGNLYMVVRWEVQAPGSSEHLEQGWAEVAFPVSGPEWMEEHKTER